MADVRPRPPQLDVGPRHPLAGVIDDHAADLACQPGIKRQREPVPTVPGPQQHRSIRCRDLAAGPDRDHGVGVELVEMESAAGAGPDHFVLPARVAIEQIDFRPHDRLARFVDDDAVGIRAASKCQVRPFAIGGYLECGGFPVLGHKVRLRQAGGQDPDDTRWRGDLVSPVRVGRAFAGELDVFLTLSPVTVDGDRC